MENWYEDEINSIALCTEERSDTILVTSCNESKYNAPLKSTTDHGTIWSIRHDLYFCLDFKDLSGFRLLSLSPETFVIAVSGLSQTHFILS
jgi:hypothetical protein